MDVQSILLIALVSVTIGYFAGMLVANLKPGKTENSDKQASPPDQAGSIEVARLVRTGPRAELAVLLDEKIIEKTDQLNPGQRKVLEEALVELLRWLGYSTMPVLNGPAQTEPAPPSDPLEPQTRVRETPPPPAISAGILDQAQKFILPAKKTGVVQNLSIVRQIDDILQERLSGTDLEARRIRLSETASQGVVVHIGLEQYQGIDEVPDVEIRELIRKCVSEWENRSR